MNRNETPKTIENIRLVRDEHGRPLYRPDNHGIARYVLVGIKSYRLDPRSTVDLFTSVSWDHTDITQTKPGLGPNANEYEDLPSRSSVALTRYALKELVLCDERLYDCERSGLLHHLGFGLQEAVDSVIVDDKLPETATGK